MRSPSHMKTDLEKETAGNEFTANNFTDNQLLASRHNLCSAIYSWCLSKADIRARIHGQTRKNGVNFMIPSSKLESKICTKCNEWKLLRHFGKSSASSDGLKGNCRVCVSVYNAKRKAVYRTPTR